jgi:hypothetical protein
LSRNRPSVLVAQTIAVCGPRKGDGRGAT